MIVIKLATVDELFELMRTPFEYFLDVTWRTFGGFRFDIVVADGECASDDLGACGFLRQGSKQIIISRRIGFLNAIYRVIFADNISHILAMLGRNGLTILGGGNRINALIVASVEAAETVA